MIIGWWYVVVVGIGTGTNGIGLSQFFSNSLEITSIKALLYFIYTGLGFRFV